MSPEQETESRGQRAGVPVPVPNFDNQGFWDGCRNHELRLQHCRPCGAFRHPPRPMCPQCTSLDYEWAPVSGRGTVYTFTIVHRPTLPAFEVGVPYNVAVVQLEEGPYLVSNIIGCRNDEIAIGMAVHVEFEDLTETVSIPKFRPVA